MRRTTGVGRACIRYLGTSIISATDTARLWGGNCEITSTAEETRLLSIGSPHSRAPAC